MSTPVRCLECGRTAARLRKDRCDACYMRIYRNGEVPPGSSCGACGERRRAVLAHADVGEGRVVLCGNCALVLARARPRLESVAELAGRVARERRQSRAGDPQGRRFADRLPPPPQLDLSID